MKDLIETIAKELVEFPEKVVVTEVENEGIVTIKLKVADSDVGKVIGKQGRIAKALRTVLKAATTNQDKKYTLDIQ